MTIILRPARSICYSDSSPIDRPRFLSFSRMTYSLSFSPEFFCDGDPDAIQPGPRPTSVYQAIVSMRSDTWAQMARNVFGVEPGRLDPWTVLEKVRETDTCGNLDPPVHVWIDEEGHFGVDVYDRAMP